MIIRENHQFVNSVNVFWGQEFWFGTVKISVGSFCFVREDFTYRKCVSPQRVLTGKRDAKPDIGLWDGWKKNFGICCTVQCTQLNFVCFFFLSICLSVSMSFCPSVCLPFSSLFLTLYWRFYTLFVRPIFL